MARITPTTAAMTRTASSSHTPEPERAPWARSRLELRLALLFRGTGTLRLVGVRISSPTGAGARTARKWVELPLTSGGWPA